MNGMDPNMMMNMNMGNMGNMPNMQNMPNMGMNMMGDMGGNMGMPGMMNNMNNMPGMTGMMNNMQMPGMTGMMNNMQMPGMTGMMNNMQMPGMTGTTGTNISIEDAQGWNLIFENQNDRQTVNVRISEQKLVKEAISAYMLKSNRTDKCKFIFNNKELFPEMKICQSGLSNMAKILVISIQNLKGA